MHRNRMERVNRNRILEFVASTDIKESQANAPKPPARTPLFELYADSNARLTNFGGWEMPVQFSGIRKEHAAVRESAGVFDISHMGRFTLSGPHLVEQLQQLVPSDLSRLQAGQAQYTVLLNAKGGILDDFIFYYQGEGDNGKQWGMAIVNAATKSRDKAWMLAHFESTSDPQAQTQLDDLTQSSALLALQGPDAARYFQPLVEADLSSLKSFQHAETQVFGQPGFISRTGYTGEDGFEILVDPETGKNLWRSLLEAGVAPCGLGARDTLRLEAALALYGQDIDPDTTPLEAGLKWLVHLDRKGDFTGRPALERQKQEGVRRRLVGLQMQGRNIARHGYPVLSDDKPVGEITSGAPSPTLGYPIALAYVPANLAKVGQELQVEIRGKQYPAVVVKKPFYQGSR